MTIQVTMSEQEAKALSLACSVIISNWELFFYRQSQLKTLAEAYATLLQARAKSIRAEELRTGLRKLRREGDGV